MSQSDLATTTDSTIDKDADIFPDSLLAVQFDANINQYISFNSYKSWPRGDNSHSANSNDEFEPDLEWGYVTANITDNSKVQAGRLRSTVFMLSESQDIGYTYPWVRPPLEVYSQVPISNYDGIKYTYDRLITDEWNMSFDTFYGADNKQDSSATEHNRGFNFFFSDDVTHCSLGPFTG